MQCDCGNITYSQAYNVINGGTQSCGCYGSEKKRKDWTGQKFYRLTFIRPTDRKNGSAIIWEALCDCGKITFVLPKQAKSGGTKSCGCLNIEQTKKRCEARRKHDPIISSALSVWQHYRDGDIDFETFFKLSQLNCEYCGKEPHRTFNVGTTRKNTYGVSDYQWKEGNFTYNGLDRVDSTKKHNMDNVVPCCFDCNFIKLDKTVGEFIMKVRNIYEHNIIQYPLYSDFYEGEHLTSSPLPTNDNAYEQSEDFKFYAA